MPPVGSVRCPDCGSNRTKSGGTRRRRHPLADGGILRAHRCLDCDRAFLSVQRVISDPLEAEEIEPLAS